MQVCVGTGQDAGTDYSYVRRCWKKKNFFLDTNRLSMHYWIILSADAIFFCGLVTLHSTETQRPGPL